MSLFYCFCAMYCTFTQGIPKRRLSEILVHRVSQIFRKRPHCPPSVNFLIFLINDRFLGCLISEACIVLIEFNKNPIKTHIFQTFIVIAFGFVNYFTGWSKFLGISGFIHSLGAFLTTF